MIYVGEMTSQCATELIEALVVFIKKIVNFASYRRYNITNINQNLYNRLEVF